MNPGSQDKIYQHIGEFVVSFQWLEDLFRQIGLLILESIGGPYKSDELRSASTAELVAKVEILFMEALPRCDLGDELEAHHRQAFIDAVATFGDVRRARNNILHSAFIEMKAGGDVVALMRANPRDEIHLSKGRPSLEILSDASFAEEMKKMGEVAWSLGWSKMQLIHRLPRQQ